MSDCFKKSGLLLPGTRQDERLQNALDPTYVLADERSLADLLVFISKYAELINYYAFKNPDQNNYIIDGDWKPLIMSDDAFNYAGISVTQYALPNITFYKYVNLYETGSDTVKRENAYRVLWDILFSLYKNIDSFYSALPVTMFLRNDISGEIKNGLINDIGITADAYLNDAVVIPGFDLQIATSSADDDYKFNFGIDVLSGQFDNIWIDLNLEPSSVSWYDYINKLVLNPAPAIDFFNALLITNDFDRIDYSTLQLKRIFKRAFEAYSRIISKANDYLQNSLLNNSAHYAHHGLMLAFLKLFDVLKLDMNEFTRKHLEYYYNRVLKINPAPAVPDSAHIVFEPAKNSAPHLIEKDTALNAGKDGIGKLMLYDTDEEIVINQAKVDQVKTLFIKPKSSADIEKIFDSPVANSADGRGAPFTGEDISWKGFGNDMNVANLGFYIASPILHLTEGIREITFEFATDNIGIEIANGLSQDEMLTMFSFFFSGEKGWEPLIIENGVNTDYNCQFSYSSPSNIYIFSIKLTLLKRCKSVVGYDASKCYGNLNTIYPVIKFSLNQSATKAYEKLKNVLIENITISVFASEITNLSLLNDSGTLDPTKPIQLFGTNPRIGSAFYIGHPELEHKMIYSFDIILNWANYPDDLNLLYYYTYKKNNSNTQYISISNNQSFTAKTEFLRNKDWQPLDKNGSNDNNSSFLNGKQTILTLLSASDLQPPVNKPENFLTNKLLFTPQTQNGFIKFTLNTSFGHDVWPSVFAHQTAATVNASSTNDVPNPPYTPTLQSVSLKYFAVQKINLDNLYDIDQGQFFHLMPFGIKEVNNKVTLLPIFQSSVKQINGSFANEDIESALIIGISNAVINQNISLLLQVAEGTEDISVDPPTVTWNYLSAIGWKNFDKLLLADSTNNLVKSGIVKFQVPVDINLNATELEKDFMWISASIENNSAGLPKMLAVLSNAVKATFSDNNNDAEHLAKPLPADKIAKLYESDAAVKKISQPYPSFGGKKTEQGNKFYTRVSERLRHKHRAITIWDYERLVLNEFPQVYMVKCLNHAGYEKDCAGAGTYKENIPGKVMLVTIPFVTNLQTGNKFQPALSGAVLSDITDFIHGNNNADTCNKYIKPLNCGLAELKVVNPKYETIKVSCKIKVKPCLDQKFYETQLPNDLNNFLSPWITGDATKINFGGRLHISQVIYFIEQLSYIDYVTNVTIEHAEGAKILNSDEPAFAVTTTSMSVLTSSNTHIILTA